MSNRKIKGAYILNLRQRNVFLDLILREGELQSTCERSDEANRKWRQDVNVAPHFAGLRFVSLFSGIGARRIQQHG